MVDCVQSLNDNATSVSVDVSPKTADRASLKSTANKDTRNDLSSWISEWDATSGVLDLSMPKLSVTVTSPEVVSSMMSRYTAPYLGLIFCFPDD